MRNEQEASNRKLLLLLFPCSSLSIEMECKSVHCMKFEDSSKALGTEKEKQKRALSSSCSKSGGTKRVEPSVRCDLTYGRMMRTEG